MPERFVTFDCEGDTLTGVFHGPDRDARDIGVLIVVGGPQYRVGSHRQFVLMARSLVLAGYPVFRFDYRGMGDSDGEQRNFESVESDIHSAISCMLKEGNRLRSVAVLGLCDAASAALMSCDKDDRVVGMILLNPWARTESGQASALIKHYYAARIFQRAFWSKLLSGKVSLRDTFGGVIGTWSRSMARSAKQSPQHFLDRMSASLRRLPKPMLLLMSGRDLTAREFDAWLKDISGNLDREQRAPLDRLDLAHADHTFSARPDLDAAVQGILQWLGTLSSSGPLSSKVGAK